MNRLTTSVRVGLLLSAFSASGLWSSFSFGQIREEARPEAPEEPEFIRPGGNVHAWKEQGEKNSEPVTRVGVEARGFGARGFGLRAGVRQSFGDGRQGSAGAMAYERAVGVLLAKFITARYFDELWLGSDGIDLTYGMALQGALGAFLPVAVHHGPFLRMEVRADLRQEGGWTFGQVRFPGAQTGWTFSRGVTQWELLFHTSVALIGHLDTGDFRRTLEGPSYGGALSLAWQELRLDADLSRIAPSDGLSPVTDLRAHACGYLGKSPEKPSKSTRGKDVPVYSGRAANDFRAAVCADVSFLSTEVLGGPLTEASQAFVGLSFLIGRFTRLDPAPQL